MQEIINIAVNTIKEAIQSNNIFLAIFISISTIILESIIPILPLAVFITVNMIVFGNVFGFLISWIATIIGCIISFTIVRKGLSPVLSSKIKSKENKRIMTSISKITLPSLIVLTALPYTPAFLINIASGLSKMSYRKFITAISISKIFIVYFWGFVGTSLIESISDLKIIIELSFLLLMLYIVSKIITKKFNIN